MLRLGDRENANYDSSLVSTKGSLIKGYLTKSLYKQFYLSGKEKALIERGDIYIHDLRDMILAASTAASSTSATSSRAASRCRTSSIPSQVRAFRSSGDR